MAEFIPEWENTGVEPSDKLKKNGFKAGYKPPAGVLNWFFNKLISKTNDNTKKAFDYYYELETEDCDLIDYDVYTEKGTYKLVTSKGDVVILVVSHQNENAWWQCVIQGRGGKFRQGTNTRWGYWQSFASEQAVNEIVGDHMIVGSYVGNGETTNTTFANLDKKPKKIEIVPARQGDFSTTNLIRDCPYSSILRSQNEAYGISLVWSTTGVTMTPASEELGNVDAENVVCNTEGVTYHYVIYY